MINFFSSALDSFVMTSALQVRGVIKPRRIFGDPSANIHETRAADSGAFEKRQLRSAAGTWTVFTGQKHNADLWGKCMSPWGGNNIIQITNGQERPHREQNVSLGIRLTVTESNTLSERPSEVFTGIWNDVLPRQVQKHCDCGARGRHVSLTALHKFLLMETEDFKFELRPSSLSLTLRFHPVSLWWKKITRDLARDSH